MLARGMRLGRYEIVEPLGAGGMGEVYRAHDTRLERDVAIKVLPETFANEPTRRARFEREARAVAALSHPNIVAIYDFGAEQGITFAVSELLEGETLRCSVSRSRLDWQKAVEFSRYIAEGLAAAHAKGIIHRDLKPENLFLTTEGRLKILDFGLARVELTPPTVNETVPYESAQTAPGTMMGTVGYMSPEQVRGHIVDARSDIFSLGCVLYEMLAGRRPFQRKTAADTTAAILHDEPCDLAQLGIQVPSAVSNVLRKCLAKRAEDRFSSAKDCAAALRSLLEDNVGLDVVVPTKAIRKTRVRRKSVDSIAMLPLVNDSADANAVYLSDGISESIISLLSRFPKLRVMARSTVFRFRGPDVDPVEVGRSLDVGAVLSGRFLLRGNRISIRLELVDVNDGALLWGEHYDREFAEVFAVENTIAREIAAKLRIQLTGDQKKRMKRSAPAAEAYQLYLKGRYFWNKRSEAGFKKSVRCFEEAIEHDPAFALSWAGLADAYHQLGIWGTVLPHNTCPKAEAAARRALEFDPDLAEAHASLGTIKREYAFDFAGAERDFQRAIELNPNYAVAHQWYGEYLGCMGRHDEAIAELERGRSLDPLSLINNASLARHGYFFARRYDEAIDQCQNAIEMDASFWVAHVFLGLAYSRTGRMDEAIAEFQKARQLDDNVETIAGLGFAHGLAGDACRARAALEELFARSKKRYVMSIGVAAVHTGLGDHEQACIWLERAYEDRNAWLSEIKVDPTFDNLRGYARFESLVERMKFPA